MEHSCCDVEKWNSWISMVTVRLSGTTNTFYRVSWRLASGAGTQNSLSCSAIPAFQKEPTGLSHRKALLQVDKCWINLLNCGWLGTCHLVLNNEKGDLLRETSRRYVPQSYTRWHVQQSYTRWHVPHDRHCVTCGTCHPVHNCVEHVEYISFYAKLCFRRIICKSSGVIASQE